ncbi:ubiquinol-cytochrome C chaperone family protein [Aestuariivirga sp.]|uniref:ubiquinol-cytochrome C chaperone family protein n=1 Tax=Aestuariivirga sp. TaxID=2650926 RepID=UPI0039E6689C
MFDVFGTTCEKGCASPRKQPHRGARQVQDFMCRQANPHALFHDLVPQPGRLSKPMIFQRLFRKEASPARRLYAPIVAAARHPVFYADWGAPDTVDGRFDLLVLHLYLVLERLKGGNEELRQALVDEFFADMDRSLREMGVGDLSVGKKVRKMAESVYGRINAYETAQSEGHDAFVAALARNVFPDGTPAGAAERLAGYAGQVQMELQAQSVESLMAGTLSIPEPRS